uniref:Putative secreted protein n=1 Tax=Anopheles triannulatus TaxID=58253 RepID=A0A2M4B5Q8_9DIPT
MRVFRPWSEFFSTWIVAAHCSCFSVHCGSFHSRSWKSTTTAGRTCRCFSIQFRLRMPFGEYHSYDWCLGLDTGNS